MKTILTLCGLILVAAVAWIVLSRPHADHHGNAFRGLPAAAIGDLADRPADYLKRDLHIEGTLSKQCPSSGCWFFLRDTGGKEVKVEMGDTSPRLPARLGKTATVEGQFIQFGDGYEFIGSAVEFH